MKLFLFAVGFFVIGLIFPHPAWFILAGITIIIWFISEWLL